MMDNINHQPRHNLSCILTYLRVIYNNLCKTRYITAYERLEKFHAKFTCFAQWSLFPTDCPSFISIFRAIKPKLLQRSVSQVTERWPGTKQHSCSWEEERRRRDRVVHSRSLWHHDPNQSEHSIWRDPTNESGGDWQEVTLKAIISACLSWHLAIIMHTDCCTADWSTRCLYGMRAPIIDPFHACLEATLMP